MKQDVILRLSKSRLLAGIFDNVSEAQMETLEILSDVDQLTQLMTGLLEAQTGQVLAFEKAFADC